MTFLLDLSLGIYLGLLTGLAIAAGFARLFWREAAAEVVTPRPAEATAPRLVASLMIPSITSVCQDQNWRMQ